MAEYDFAQLLTVRECAHALPRSESTVRRAVRAGRIHAFRLAAAGQLKISVRALDAIIGPEVTTSPPDADFVAEIREVRGSS
jgi:Helix-turn-helix domain